MSNKIKLYSESLTVTDPQDGFLDLDGKTIVPLNFAIADVRDISKRKGTFSKSITIPGTKNNHRILNNYFDVNVQAGTFDINRLQKCAVIQDDVVVLDNAVMQLVSVNKSQPNGRYESDVTYTVVIKDTAADFFSVISNRTLDQLDFNWMSHIYTSSNVVDSFSNTVEDGYKYVMPYNASVGDNDAQFSLVEFTPAIYAKHYWDQIFASAGFTYDWPGMTSPDIRFDKLLIPYNGDAPTASRENSQFYGFISESTGATAVQNQFTGSRQRIISSTPMPSIGATNEISDPNNVFNPTTGIYSFPFLNGTNNSVVFTYEVEYIVKVINNSTSTRWLRKDISNQGDLRIKPTLLINGTNVFFSNTDLSGDTPINLPNLYSVPGSSTQIIQAKSVVNSISIPGIPSQTNISIRGLLDFWVGNQQVNPSSSVGYHWSSSSTVDTSVNDVKIELQIKTSRITAVVQLEGAVGYNVPIVMNKFIPKNIKQSDFIKGVAQMFNLYISPDNEVSTKLNIVTRDEYYDSGVEKDWTYKLAKDKAQDIKFLPEIVNKKLLLTYKEDKDWANASYKSNTNEVYGQAEFVFDNEYVKDTTKVELIFSPTPTANTSFGAVCPIWNGQAPKTNIRILYDGGPRPCQPYTIWNYGVDPGATGSVASNSYLGNITTYPFVGHWDQPSNPTFDLQFLPSDYYYRSDNWGVNTNNNLFNLHWRRTANQLNSGKLLEAYFDLKSIDIQLLKLNDKIRIDNSLWNINKIQDYDANSNSLTKVELISADDLLAPDFITQDSIGVDRNTVLWPDTRQLTYEQAKVRNLIYSEGDVVVDGVNNIISPYVRYASVVGDGNNVGSNSIVIGNNNVVPESSTSLVVGSDITVGATSGIYTDNIIIGPSGSINGTPIDQIAGPSASTGLWLGGTGANAIIQKNGGTANIASGANSLALGLGTSALGTQAVTMGAGTTASGNQSLAEGTNTQATGLNSHAEGNLTIASGLNSHAEGSGSIASGNNSHAGGIQNTSATYAETVIGSFASSISGTANFFNPADPVFRIGNGVSGTPSDAFRVYKNGAAYLKPITTASVTSPITGMLLFDSSVNDLKLYDGSTWSVIGKEDPIVTTGVSIDWQIPRIYNTPTSPGTGNITSSVGGARLGIIQKIYHNSATAPTVPASWVLLSGYYKTSQLNIIYTEYSTSTRVEYWII